MKKYFSQIFAVQLKISGKKKVNSKYVDYLFYSIKGK